MKSAMSEDAPYPTKFVDPVSAAMAEAEKAVLCAATAGGSGGNGSARGTALRTCSVRAAAVYGPEEQQPESSLIGGLAGRTRTGTRPLGDGKNVVDFVYAGNVAHALLLAAQGLLGSKAPPSQAPEDGRSPAPSSLSGRAFFVTDAEPVPYCVFAGRALSRLGYPVPAGDSAGAGIPLAIAGVLAFLLRVLALVVSPVFEFRPALTARRVAEEGRACRFDVSRARQELGYSPLWTQEVMEVLVKGAGVGAGGRAGVKCCCTARDNALPLSLTILTSHPYYITAMPGWSD